MYGMVIEKAKRNTTWNWSKISSPIFKCSDKVTTLLSTLQCSILKISVTDASNDPIKGADKPFEAIFVSSKAMNKDLCDPLIVILHGGPQDVSLSLFSKSWAFLSSAGYKHYHSDGKLSLQHFIIFFGVFELLLSQLPDIHSLRWVNALCTFSTIGFAGTTIGVTIYNGKKIDRTSVNYSLQGSYALKSFKAL